MKKICELIYSEKVSTFCDVLLQYIHNEGYQTKFRLLQSSIPSKYSNELFYRVLVMRSSELTEKYLKNRFASILNNFDLLNYAPGNFSFYS